MRTRIRYLSDVRKITTQISDTGISIPRSTMVFVEQDSMTDTLTPDYFLKVQKGLDLPINNCTKVRSTNREDGMNMFIQDQSGARHWVLSGQCCQFNTASWSLSWPSLTLPKFPGLTQLLQQAQAQALSRVDKPRYDFGEPIAELLHTVRDLKRPLNAIKRLSTRFTRDLSHRERVIIGSDRVADLWRNYSFYAGPNVRLLNDIVDAYATRNYKRPAYRSARGKSSYASGYVDGKSTGNVSGWVTDRISRRVYTVEVRAVIRYSVTDANSKGELLGLRARDLPGIAWELVPLSFLVDRVLNVSRFIHVASRFASGNVKIVGAYYTVKIVDDNQRTLKGMRRTTPDPLNFAYPADTRPWTVRTETFNRSTWIPSLWSLAKVQPFGLTSTLSSTLDTVSLIVRNLYQGSNFR